MAEGTTAVSLPSSAICKNTSPFSSSFRFLRFADHTNSSPSQGNHFELDEGDVVWSTDLYSDLSSAGDNLPTSILSSCGDRDSSLWRRSFQPEKFGLSAALAEDHGLPVQQRRPSRRALPSAEMNKVFHQSAPMNVPAWPRARLELAGTLVEVKDDDMECEGEEQMLPPHEIVARSHVMTFSVFEGVGRTLKGRDLRRVRNAVFQKTGFLD